MSQAELMIAINGLSFPDWVLLVCSIEGAVKKLGLGGVLIRPIGLPLLIDWVTSSRGPGLVALQEAYDRCFHNPLTHRAQRGVRSLLRKHPWWASIVTTGIIASIAALWFWWSCLFGLDFRDFYDQVRLAVDLPGGSNVSEVHGHIGESICWDGVATSSQPAGDQVMTFTVKPVGVEEDPKPSQVFTVYPQHELRPTVFARLPVKIRFRGRIKNVEPGNGVTIHSTHVSKLE